MSTQQGIAYSGQTCKIKNIFQKYLHCSTMLATLANRSCATYYRLYPTFSCPYNHFFHTTVKADRRLNTRPQVRRHHCTTSLPDRQLYTSHRCESCRPLLIDTTFSSIHENLKLDKEQPKYPLFYKSRSQYYNCSIKTSTIQECITATIK